MGEHCVRNAGVEGSNPFASTILILNHDYDEKPFIKGLFCVIEEGRFGLKSNHV